MTTDQFAQGSQIDDAYVAQMEAWLRSQELSIRTCTDTVLYLITQRETLEKRMKAEMEERDAKMKVYEIGKRNLEAYKAESQFQKQVTA